MNVKIVQLPAFRVAYVSHRGPYNKTGPAWNRLTSELGKTGFLGPQTRFFGLSYDDPLIVPPILLRYEACATVPEDYVPIGELKLKLIAGGDFAMLCHAGPRETLGASYGLLIGKWLPFSGRRSGHAPCMEEFLNSQENTAPQDLRTNIYLPLKPLE